MSFTEVCELLMTEVTSFVLGYQTQGGHTPTIPCYGNYFMIVHIIGKGQRILSGKELMDRKTVAFHPMTEVTGVTGNP